jgi:hypothetical protein
MADDTGREAPQGTLDRERAPGQPENKPSLPGWRVTDG